MRIVINGTAAVAGGSVTYLLNLLPALSDIDKTNDYTILLSDSQDGVHLNLPSNFQIKRVHFPRPQLLCRLLWEQTILPIWLARMAADVLYSPMDIAPLLAPCPVILAVRNPYPYYETAYARHQRFRLQKIISEISSRKANKVLFVSNYSRDTMAPKLGLSRRKTKVVYHGLDHTKFNPEKDFSVPPSLHSQIQGLEPFVLCVSTINPHKNYETLLQAWSNLGKNRKEKYHLVIAGGVSDTEYFERLNTLIQELGIANDVVFLGELPYQSMPYIYKRAFAFTFPSKLETFGHPLVEAMAMRVPIVAASSTCIPEIVSGSALLFDPNSSKDLSLKLEQILTKSSLREKLIETGQLRAQVFSWQETAQKTLRIIELAASMRSLSVL
jgi:glycosyltransferase involved in cell wall biosynthesis